ncbi:hypothetical protein C8A03DRAFT_37632 [Achaetomium macrosporum]|uniref:F-box domain-containing protein n=1 Tax=Achaetomium macrosporum TaxID=79813 RepID=A0AAN7H4J9_9PEZI|nr:hypothetical protein C8A03DRAFT_37632 [Achaetomium macrosporum]
MTNSLLGLPADLRRRIYLHTGVARLDGRPWTYFLDGSTQPVSEYDRPSTRARSVLEWMLGITQPASDVDETHTPRNFAGLLRSCRALYVETAALLYSANRFVIFYSHLGGSFDRLRALSPTSLASLTSLKIVLNETCCESSCTNSWCDSHGLEHHDCQWPAKHQCAKKRGGQHRRPLLDSVPGPDSTAFTSAKQEIQVMMGEWSRTVAHISPQIGIGRLELSFICDVDPEHPYALEAARLALAPVSLLPRLRECHVRLSKSSSYPLQQMAQEAVLQACGRASPARLGPVHPRTTSALTNLPRELRIRILEYTDLITPWKEVTWSRQHRGYQVVRALCASSSFPCPPENHHGCRLSRCKPRRSSVPPAGGCFCRRQHSAFSSSVCHCWAPPTNLFLICRTLCRDAQFVFFSRNRFIIHDFHAWQPWDLPAEQLEPPDSRETASTTSTASYPFERLAVSEFLREVVPIHCLPYLRFLELVFPPYVPHGWPHREHPATLDWVATVDWVRGRVNAPALTVRLVMADFGAGRFTGRRAMTKEQADDILRGYSCIISPLKPLVRGEGDGGGGLAGFYVQLAHPARWTLDVLRRAQLDNGFLARLHQKLVVWAVGYLRGPGSNTPLDHPNRPEPSKSTWQRWYEVDPDSG